MKIFVASAFSKDGAGGNLAGVCLYGEGLGRQGKIAIARELGFSETAFVSAGQKGDFLLEYFTPTDEVDLCGHATIAAFVVMRKLLPLKKDKFIIETKSGNLAVFFDGDLIFMEQNKPEFFEILEPADVAGCFGGDVVDSCLPIEIGSTGLKDIILPVKNLQILENMKPNFDKISEISDKFGVVGVHAFTIDGARVVCRNFAPLYGIDEEAATGTSNCVLASYLWKNGILRQDEYIFEQGYNLGNPSEIIVRLDVCGGDIKKVNVGGRGHLVQS